jgi:hypothetical protein
MKLSAHAPHYRSRANEQTEPQPAPAESPAESKAVFGVQICKTLRSPTGAEQMSEEFWREQVNQMIDQNKDLTRERDEARARVKVLEGLVTELTMDLENEIDARYGQDIHPAMKRRYENDIEVCRRARAALQEQSK